MASAPIKLSPFGPITTPDNIRPIMAGILAFLNNIGERRMINNINEKTNTGLCNGNLNSESKCSKK